LALPFADQGLRTGQVDLVADVEGEEPDEVSDEAHVPGVLRPAARHYDPFFRCGVSGTRMVSTGTCACRTTFSATLPMSRWLRPLRPAVLMTIESARRAASRMHCEASPTSTRQVYGGASPRSARATSASRCLRCSGTNVVGAGKVSAARPNGTSAGT